MQSPSVLYVFLYLCYSPHMADHCLSNPNEPCPKRVMICYVVSFCLRHQLTPPYACGVFAYATHLEVLLTPPACATLRAWSFSLRAGRYDMTLAKHVHGGFGRCSNDSSHIFSVAGKVAWISTPHSRGSNMKSDRIAGGILNFARVLNLPSNTTSFT